MSSLVPNHSSITGGGRGGRVLLLNNRYIAPGTVDTTGYYNHYSALRSYEDLLGLVSGGADGEGHLGFAAAAGLTPFGQDVFQPDEAPTITTDPQSQSVATGGTLTFTAAADITTPTVQWQLSVNGGSTWLDIGGPSTASLTATQLNAFENGWEVRAVFTNHLGSAATIPATITVLPPATSVVFPSAGTTASGVQDLDAAASPGVTRVQYELSGNGLTDDVVAHGHRHALRLARQVRHDDRAERDLRPPERRHPEWAHRHQFGRHRDCGQCGAGHECGVSLRRHHGVGPAGPRRRCLARGHAGPVRAQRQRPDGRRRRDGHRHALRLARPVEHGRRCGWHLRPAKRRFVRRRRLWHEPAHHRHGEQLTVTVTVSN